MGADAENDFGHQVRKRERRGDADRNADQRQFRALPEDETQDVRRMRSERQTDADFVDALANDIGDHAVNADR